MSRAFEVLERVQEDRELFRVPPTVKVGPSSHHNPTDGKSTFSDLGIAREEILGLVQRLFLSTEHIGHCGPRRVVFCSVDNAEGSNLLCTQIGRILAEQVQSQVCIVDANVRMPTSPLLDVLPSFPSQTKSEFEDAPWLRITDNLSLVSGNSMPSHNGVLTLDDVRRWIRGPGDQFAYMVISAPPIGLYSDAGLLGQVADGVVLVVEANSTRRIAARRAKQTLEDSNVRVLGAVLNNRTFPIPERIYRLL